MISRYSLTQNQRKQLVTELTSLDSKFYLMGKYIMIQLLKKKFHNQGIVNSDVLYSDEIVVYSGRIESNKLEELCKKVTKKNG